MATERKCEDFRCNQVSVGLLSVAPGTSLWFCRDHMLEMIKQIQKEGKVNG